MLAFGRTLIYVVEVEVEVEVEIINATAIPSVCPSVGPSVTRRYCVKTTARNTVQFALSDSKMCLVL